MSQATKKYAPLALSLPPLLHGLVQKIKTEMVLGRSESARFRRAFDRADFSRDGRVTSADAARAYRELGGKTTEDEV